VKEPCPFCGNRVEAVREPSGVKTCPICHRRWIESGGGISTRSGGEAPPPEAVAV